MIKVSIIIPIYNVEKYLTRCLESVVKQTYKNIEIICVDDCGQDRSMDIVEQYYSMYPEIMTVIYSNENVGLGGARDKGIEKATGDYITFIDSDDYIKEDYVETYIDAAQKTKADLIIGGYIRDNGKRRKTYPVHMHDPAYAWVNISAWAKFYKTDFLRKNDLSFDGVRIYEDECFIYKILLKQPRKSMIDYCGYYYWLNPNSITKSKTKDRSDFFIKYTKNIKTFISRYSTICKRNELLQYCLASGLTANLLYNGQKSGNKINKLYEEYDIILKSLGENVCKNKYLKRRKLKSEPMKKKYAMRLIMALRRIHCDKFLIKLVGMI